MGGADPTKDDNKCKDNREGGGAWTKEDGSPQAAEAGASKMALGHDDETSEEALMRDIKRFHRDVEFKEVLCVGSCSSLH